MPRLGICYKRWSDEEERQLRRLYPTTKTKALSTLLSRSPGAIRLRASLLGIKANRAYHYLESPELNPYDKLGEAQRAYIAGIVDGEGCIGLYNHHSKYTKTKKYSYRLPRIDISNNSETLMHWLKSNLGGCVCVIKRYNDNHLPGYCWHLRGNIQVKWLLKVILPYLIIKRDKALEILNHHTTFEYVEERYIEQG